MSFDVSDLTGQKTQPVAPESRLGEDSCQNQ